MKLAFLLERSGEPFRMMSEGVIMITWNHLDHVWKKLLVAGGWHREKVEK